jgi:hypothetical protein
MTTMSIRGVSLFVKVIGQGYPLALMHGGPGLDHTTMTPLRPLALIASAWSSMTIAAMAARLAPLSPP